MDAPTLFAGLSLIVSAIALLVALQRPKVDLVNDGVRTSADELSATLARLRRALWDTAKTDESSGVALSAAVHDVRLAFEIHRPHLPTEIAVLGREVSMAVGNYAGAPGLAYVSPEASDYPISAHDPYWWDITVTYVDYAIARVQAWRRDPQSRRPSTIRFHEWRRADDAQRERIPGDATAAASE